MQAKRLSLSECSACRNTRGVRVSWPGASTADAGRLHLRHDDGIPINVTARQRLSSRSLIRPELAGYSCVHVAPIQRLAKEFGLLCFGFRNEFSGWRAEDGQVWDVEARSIRHAIHTSYKGHGVAQVQQTETGHPSYCVPSFSLCGCCHLRLFGNDDSFTLRQNDDLGRPRNATP